MSITVDSNIRAYRETNVWEDLMASDGQPFGPSAEYPFIVVKVSEAAVRGLVVLCVDWPGSSYSWLCP